MSSKYGKCPTEGKSGVRLIEQCPTWVELVAFCRCGEERLIGKLSNPFPTEERRQEIISTLREKNWCQGENIRCPACADNFSPQ
jgi:hypothetical protein